MIEQVQDNRSTLSILCFSISTTVFLIYVNRLSREISVIAILNHGERFFSDGYLSCSPFYIFPFQQAQLFPPHCMLSGPGTGIEKEENNEQGEVDTLGDKVGSNANRSSQ